jgi:magnesium chelatase family protein
VSEKQKIESGFARVYGAQPSLPHGTLVSVECDIVKGLHAYTIVGLPDKSVEEAKDRIAAAIKNTGEFESPKKSNKKIVLSLAPAGLKKEGAVFDLPIALSFLLASEQLMFDPARRLFAGELALDGTVRPIQGALSIAMTARSERFREIFVPEENAAEASLVSGLTVIPVTSLMHCARLLIGDEKPRVVYAAATVGETDDAAFDEIRGQEAAKRGLVIAAAGGHNIAFFGPPGTGKTLLARAAASIMPDLDEDGMLEVTAIHSLAGTLHDGVVRRPPFRSPHHTSSYASLIGGGSAGVKPGEATLAHRGILFCDEFPEFRRDVIQALREPLEDRVVSISRSRGSAVFPADFMLIAALNPCPCGFYGTSRCECMPHIVEKYRRKVSGPVADRIDMWVQVGEMPLEQLAVGSGQKAAGETRKARDEIQKARDIQRTRFSGTKVRTNAGMRPKEISALAAISKTAEDTLLSAAKSLKLSPRGYHRTIKLARTIRIIKRKHSWF